MIFCNHYEDFKQIRNCVKALIPTVHCTKNPIYISQKWNCSASFPIPTFMYLWAIYIFPGSVCLFGCCKIGRPIVGIYTCKSLTDTWMWKLGGKILLFCFANNGRTVSFLGIYIGFSPAVHFQCTLLIGMGVMLVPESCVQYVQVVLYSTMYIVHIHV